MLGGGGGVLEHIVSWSTLRGAPSLGNSRRSGIERHWARTLRDSTITKVCGFWWLPTSAASSFVKCSSSSPMKCDSTKRLNTIPTFSQLLGGGRAVSVPRSHLGTCKDSFGLTQGWDTYTCIYTHAWLQGQAHHKLRHLCSRKCFETTKPDQIPAEVNGSRRRSALLQPNARFSMPTLLLSSRKFGRDQVLIAGDRQRHLQFHDACFHWGRVPRHSGNNARSLCKDCLSPSLYILS